MGRVNARDAGNSSNIQNIVVLIFMGLLLVAVFGLQICLWVSNKLTGEPEMLSKNPFQTLIHAAKGTTHITPLMIVTGIALIIVLLLPFIMIGVSRAKKGTVRVDEAARYLAPKKDIASFSQEAAIAKARQWLPEPLATTHPGLRFGKIPKRGFFSRETPLYSCWEDLFLVVFGPRMGKTSGIIVPAIVDAPGPVITTSNKRDIVDDTIGVTGQRGRVYVFDPQRIAAGFEQDPWFFDPLDFIRREPDKMDSAALKLANIFKCAAFEKSHNKGGDAFFEATGRSILASTFLAAALADKPITVVSEWITEQSFEPVNILKDHGWHTHAKDLRASLTATEKTRSGFFSEAQQMAQSLRAKIAAEWVTPQPGSYRFSPEDFVRSSHDTVYLLSKEGVDNAAALTTAFTAAVMAAAEAYGEECGGRLPVPLLAPLDEAANTVQWSELPQLYSHYGSRSIILITILQSYSQGISVWGEEGMEAMWSAASILIYGGGVRDEKMLNKLELLIGDVEEWTSSVSYAQGTRTVSEQKRERKILTAAELASLGDNRAIVFATQRRPIVIELERFWDRKYWSEEIQSGLAYRQAKRKK